METPQINAKENRALDTAIVDEQDYGESDSYLAYISDVGTYMINVKCRDESGNESIITSVAQVRVIKPELEIRDVTYTSDEFEEFYVGNSVAWFANVSGGYLPYAFIYNVIKDDVVIDSSYTESPVFEYQFMQSGTYYIEVVCTDSSGEVTTGYSAPIAVHEIDAIIPPYAYTIESEITLSMSDITVPKEVQSIRIGWNSVSSASEYGLKLERITESGDITLIDISTANTEYVFERKLFAGFDEISNYRISITSINEESSEPNQYYFSFLPDESDYILKVDGKEEVIWHSPTRDSVTRTFEIESSVDWTASCNVNWIILSMYDGYLGIDLEENDYDIRDGEITISNGATDVKIVVKQGKDNDAPQLAYPFFSADGDNESVLPLGDFWVFWKDCNYPYIGIRILDKDGNVCYDKVVKNKDEYAITMSEVHLDNSVAYTLQLSGHLSQHPSEYELNDFQVLNSYFFITDASECFITLDGSQEKTVSLLEESNYVAFIESSNIWSATPDVEWIKWVEPSHDDYYLNGDLRVSLQPNYTGETRTGIITLTSGTSHAYLTVTQNPWLTCKTTSGMLSKNQSSPTSIYTDDIIFITSPKASVEKLSGSTWENVVTLSDRKYVYLEEYCSASWGLNTTSTYRFVLQHEDNIEYYYFKYKTRTSYLIIKTISIEGDTTGSTTSCYVSNDGASLGIGVISSGTWTASTNTTWITVEDTSGSKSTDWTRMTIDVDENTTGSERTGTVTYKRGTAKTATLTITQSAGSDFTLFLDEDGLPIYGARNEIYDPARTVFNGNGDSIYISYSCATQSDIVFSDSLCDWISCDGNSLELDSNNTGEIRYGSVQFYSGLYTKTITIAQAPMIDAPYLSSPILSHDHRNPSIIDYDDLILTFPAVEGAVSYNIYLKPADQSLYQTDRKSFIKDIYADGSDYYSVVVPQERTSLTPTTYDTLRIRAYDEYGYSHVTSYYFVATKDGCVLINGRTLCEWNDVYDLETSETFSIYATGEWTAYSETDWITLDKHSGDTSDSINVTVAQNNGEERTGYVKFSSGGAISTLTVNQCAILPYSPEDFSPAFSTDENNPTIIPSDTTKISLTWKNYPQATYYVHVVSFYGADGVLGEVIDDSGRLKENKYLLSDLSLEPGQLYILVFQLSRKGSYNDLRTTTYYFMPQVDYAFVSVPKNNLKLDGDDDYTISNVSSSGVWVARTEDDWLMVSERAVSDDDLKKYDMIPSDFSEYMGRKGSPLYISAPTNNSGFERTGTITITCCGEQTQITVTQKPYYKRPELISPEIGQGTGNDMTIIPYGDVPLYWTSGDGGTGEYSVKLSECTLKGAVISNVFTKTNITGRSYTIPASKLVEGKNYRLNVGVVLNDTGDTKGTTYFFHVASENDLSVLAETIWKSNGVDITAYASGGEGAYSYAFTLLKDGEKAEECAYSSQDNYGFNITCEGNYQIKVYVKDGTGIEKSFLSAVKSYYRSDFTTLSLSLSTWIPSAAGETTTVDVIASKDWTITNCSEWITCSQSSGYGDTTLQLSVPKNTEAERSGKLVVRSGSILVTLSVIQGSRVLSKPVITSLSDSDTVPFADLVVRWNDVTNADHYHFTVYDQNNQVYYQLRYYGNPTVTIPASSFIGGHTYTIEIEARISSEDAGASASSTEISFTVAESSQSITIGGNVYSSAYNPIEDAVISVYADIEGSYRQVATTKTDSNGGWSLDGLSGTTDFSVEVWSLLYDFDLNCITVCGSNEHIDFIASNSIDGEAGFEVSISDASVSSDSESVYVKITSNGDWFITPNSRWIIPSVSYGQGTEEVYLTVLENEYEAKRIGTVTIRDVLSGEEKIITVSQDKQPQEVHMISSSENDDVDIFVLVEGYETVLLEKQNTTNTKKGQLYTKKTNTIEAKNDDLFDETHWWSSTMKYNGHPIVKGFYQYGHGNTFVIDQEMEIPSNTTIKINGDLEIKGKNGNIKFGNSSVLEVSGSVKISSKGTLDMCGGGTVKVGSDFVYDSSGTYDGTSKLSNGTIKVSGSITLKDGFYPSGKQEIHVIGKGKHEISVSKGRFNKFFVDDQGIEGLVIKDDFSCNNNGGMYFSQNSILVSSNPSRINDSSIVLINSIDRKSFDKNIQKTATICLMTLVQKNEKSITVKKIPNGVGQIFGLNTSGSVYVFDSDYQLKEHYINCNLYGYAGMQMGNVQMDGIEFGAGPSMSSVNDAIIEFRKEVLKWSFKNLMDIFVEPYKEMLKELVWGELPSLFSTQYGNAYTIPKTISGGKYIEVYDVAKFTKEMKSKKDTIKKYVDILKKLNDGTYGY